MAKCNWCRGRLAAKADIFYDGRKRYVFSASSTIFNIPMTRILKKNWSLLYVLFFSLLVMPVLAGPKGSLEPNELEWVKNTFKPILIKGNICVRADADCNHNFLICMSSDTLSCDVYGITDEVIIKEILLAALNSGMNVSSWSFWKSKYHEVRLFEKPLLEYRDRTEGKNSGAK